MQHVWLMRITLLPVIICVLSFVAGPATVTADDVLQLVPPNVTPQTKHIVLISGDEEYRSEEALPMLAKILSQRHGFRCTVLFSFGPDGAPYIDPNNQQGLRGIDALRTANLMIIATRFRTPDPEQAAWITAYLNAGRPVIGLRTATHAFRGRGTFGGTLAYDDFGRRILGEQWVSHHGRHKVEGTRGVTEPGAENHPILRGVNDVFAPSDVYGVVHLTEDDEILLRGGITESLDPDSPLVDDERNDPMHPLAWLHTWRSPNGDAEGRSFCTTAGAAVDFLNEDLRRLVVNAALYLTDRPVPDRANVDFVDPYYPAFYGFIRDPLFWPDLARQPEDYGLGQSPATPDPPGSPKWPFRPVPPLVK